MGIALTNLGVDFCFCEMYNSKKLIYYTILFNFCQEKGNIIMEDGDREFLIKAIAEAIAECIHIDTLDLVYKILIADDIQ